MCGSDSSRRYVRHWPRAEAEADSVGDSDYTNVQVNDLCIKLAELFR
jgi:hypothetical protein